MLHRSLKKIRENRKFIHVFFYIDETTDPREKYIANFIVGQLNVDSKSYLLASKVLEKTNNNIKAKFVNDCIKVLWPEGGNMYYIVITSLSTPSAENNLDCIT